MALGVAMLSMQQPEPGAAADPAADSPSRRDRTSVVRAALFIQQAVDGVERRQLRETSNARRAFLLHMECLPITTCVVWGLVALTFFERPYWCTQPEVLRSVEDPCGNPMYPSYPIHYLSTAAGYVIECVLVALIAVDVFLLAFSQGQEWKHGLARNRVIMLFVYFCDLLVSFFTPPYAVRIAPYLRIGFVVCYSHGTRSRFKLIVNTLPAVANIFAIGLLYITFFAWLGVIFFPLDTGEGSQYFEGLGSGMWSLLILLTTANYPDVMMPAYRDHRESFLFFFVFVSLGVFFLVNMLTAVIFSVYQQVQEKNTDKTRAMQSECIRAAHRLLATDGRISTDVVRQLFAELNHFHDITYITESHAERLIARLDADNNGVIEEGEFDSIIEVLTAEYQRGPKHPLLERRFPSLTTSPCWQGLKKVVMHRFFDGTVDVLLVGTLVLSIVETWPDITGTPRTHKVDNEWDQVEHLFMLVFVAEALLKISTMGLLQYWESPKNKFDFILTVVTAVVTVYVWLPNAYNNPSLIRVIAAFRALRVLRLIHIVPGCTAIIHTFVRIGPEAFAICKVLFCAMYVFSAVGTQIFGGVINQDPKSKYSARIAASDFGQAGYWPNNFNDMPSGMVVLFELLVVNNWFVISDGYTAACGPQARIFFIAFYVFGVVICLNIVVAFILDSFMNELNHTLERRSSGSLMQRALSGE